MNYSKQIEIESSFQHYLLSALEDLGSLLKHGHLLTQVDCLKSSDNALRLQATEAFPDHLFPLRRDFLYPIVLLHQRVLFPRSCCPLFLVESFLSPLPLPSKTDLHHDQWSENTAQQKQRPQGVQIRFAWSGFVKSNIRHENGESIHHLRNVWLGHYLLSEYELELYPRPTYS
ncbi:hypothetical protein C240_1783 [Enterococcus sp. 5H]|nr:hypothetical protein [Enterococcus sp. 5H]